jgi:sugar phosphate isomerase/epimerase
MLMTRRRWLAGSLATLPFIRPLPELFARAENKKRLGIVSYSYHLRVSADRAKAATAGFADPLVFLDHCQAIGAGGIQLDLGIKDQTYIGKLRQRLQDSGMYLEGSIRLPRNQEDVERFASEVRMAKEAGAKVLRTVMMSGRRYEIFDSAEAFRLSAERAWQSLVLAEPIAARENMRLAIENHKDWRTEELVEILRRLRSPHVGACVDFGNSIALLEDPMQVVEKLAPFAMTTHIKDMALEEYDQGFLLSEVPLGQGILNLPKMIEILNRKNASIHYNLEMITRDPLQVPCLEKEYWAALDKLPGQDLARTLTSVRKNKPKGPLTRIGGLSKDQQIELEDRNVRKCLAYANEHLNL